MTYPGKRNPNWHGGTTKTYHGYIRVLVGTDHHLSDSKGYAYEHRMIAEKMLGRELVRGEFVHHINGIKTDNRPENLMVVNQNRGHFLLHRKPHSNRRKPGEPNPVLTCNCGCGATFPKFDGHGRPRKFISGHNPQNINRANGRFENAIKN